MLQNPWRIEMLGGLRVCQEGHDPALLSRRQTGALLAYLALSLNRSHTRESLMALIWPEDAPEVARHKLRQSLYALRRQMESDPAGEKDLFLTAHDTIQLDPALFNTDVAQFEQALRAATRSTDISERIRFLSVAVGLYGGELLPGFYLEAFELERNRLAELYRSALLTLMHAYEEAGDLKHAIETGHSALVLDPLVEETHCDLMRLYAADRQPSAILRQYQRLTSILRTEVGRAPAQSTRLLMESLWQSAQAGVTVQKNTPVQAVTPSTGRESPVGFIEARVPLLTSASTRLSPPGRNRLRSTLALPAIAFCLLTVWQTFKHSPDSTNGSSLDRSKPMVSPPGISSSALQSERHPAPSRQTGKILKVTSHYPLFQSAVAGKVDGSKQWYRLRNNGDDVLKIKLTGLKAGEEIIDLPSGDSLDVNAPYTLVALASNADTTADLEYTPVATTLNDTGWTQDTSAYDSTVINSAWNWKYLYFDEAHAEKRWYRLMNKGPKAVKIELGGVMKDKSEAETLFPGDTIDVNSPQILLALAEPGDSTEIFYCALFDKKRVEGQSKTHR